ncbi:MAG TPA: TonB-dependent receptor, partial [Opitutus sp.]|nr:TonB-dependent receptor [Opitutus sp.]
QLSNDPLAGASFTHVGSLGARAWRLQAGALFTQSRINAANFTNVLGRRGALTASSLNTATNLEEFVESQLALSDRLTFVAGTTAAQTRRVSQRRAGSAPSYTRTYHNLSPKLGLRFDAPDFQLYANVSRSFEPPSFSETGALAAPNRAQTATTVELGTRGGRGSARWDLSLYQAQLRDEFLSLNDPAGTPLGTINADRTVHRGVEFSAEFDLLNPAAIAPIDPAAPRLMLRGAWLWSRFRFDDDRTYRHNTLAGFPPHVVRAELTWETARGWYAGPHCEWVPQRAPVDHANTLFADPYALCSFRLGRRTARGLSFFAEIRNASDRSYAATTGVIADARGQDQRQFLPGDGRSFYTGAEYRW